MSEIGFVITVRGDAASHMDWLLREKATRVMVGVHAPYPWGNRGFDVTSVGRIPRGSGPAVQLWDGHDRAACPDCEGRTVSIRESAAAHLEALAANYPEDVFPADSTSRDAISGTAMRHAYLNAARSIRENWETDTTI